MTTKQALALVFLILAAVLAAVAAFVPPVQGRLLSLAVAALAIALAVEEAP
jgi:hypothetical protein